MSRRVEVHIDILYFIIMIPSCWFIILTMKQYLLQKPHDIKQKGKVNML